MNSQQEAVVHLDIRDDGVAIVQIDRPESKNALNSAVRQQLAEHFRELARNKSVRAIVLTGGEQFFVAGADIREFASASPVEMYQRHTEYLWEAIGRCPKPVVAAVNGFALGGGCELAMHCDIIIAGESARFGQPEVKLGLMPGAGGTQRLIRAVGKFQAMRIALTGCMVKAPEALAIGMISEVVGDERTLPRAIELATEIAALPPLAVAQIKEVLLAGADLPLEGALALERKAFQLLFDSKDQKEGTAAFFEKRKANFRGE
ncbi:Enoyl-CoA hydratase/carnithine racemase [Azotobacter beijerinckii]|uniref:Enoyl-CoA hydratase/carnithine racemase n=1 Tax=Azotobacter beijerinckii TaxID=170623 RepID=A0A1H6YA39_9GAMM|nr:enoyl-CoA hydratase [Azotobacter beijerinckii]SEJ38148.1 Enoyl-CoA hydratase/carnithine racemase [Azotobacter beijerinckii]